MSSKTRSPTIGSDPTEKRLERLEERVRKVERENRSLERELWWLKTTLMSIVLTTLGVTGGFALGYLLASL